MTTHNLYLMGEINSNNCNALIKDIHKLEEDLLHSTKTTPRIKLYLKTFGGSVIQGLAVHDVIKASSLPIEVIALGNVHSIGIPIYLACKSRYSYPNTSFMIHNISTTDFTGTRVEQCVDTKYSSNLQNKINKIILDNTLISKKLLKNKLKSNIDWYLSLEDCLKFNIVKGIL